jgi:hypothetical protein
MLLSVTAWPVLLWTITDFFFPMVPTRQPPKAAGSGEIARPFLVACGWAAGALAALVTGDSAVVEVVGAAVVVVVGVAAVVGGAVVVDVVVDATVVDGLATVLEVVVLSAAAAPASAVTVTTASAATSVARTARPPRVEPVIARPPHIRPGGTTRNRLGDRIEGLGQIVDEILSRLDAD